MFWSVVEIFQLVGRRKTSFGRSSKNFVWTVGEILRLVGRRNSSFGRSSKFFVWSVVEKLRLDGRRNLSSGPTSKIWTIEFFLDGRRKISFWEVQDKLMDNV